MTDNEFVQNLTNMRETMYRICCAHISNASDRDDAVQETLLKAWKSRGSLREERYMQTWVVRILINECRDIGRRQKQRAEEELPDWLPSGGQADSDDSVKELREALFKLDEKLRIPVVLHYIEGYSTSELSKMLGAPKGTVLWRLSKAREKLKAMLSSDNSGGVYDV